ncbi:MAG: right-handed parallel beta-helix repeat-containing protein [bacterium]
MIGIVIFSATWGFLTLPGRPALSICSALAAKLEVGTLGYAYTSIQAAIDQAVSGQDEVLVYPGIYRERISFKGRNITVRSAMGADLTIIDGYSDGGSSDIDGTSDSGSYRESVVTFNQGEGADAVLDGFTIQNGYASYGYGHTLSGGGILCYYSSPTIVHCIIRGNKAQSRGGGISIYGSSPVITSCIISNNSAWGGGGIFALNSSAAITSCIISNNSADGGGGGIYGEYLSSVITNCLIIDNTAGYNASGLWIGHGSATVLINCTISGNTADYNGSGLYCSDASVKVINCILWGDTDNFGPHEVMVIENGSATVTCSDVQQDSGTYPGTGNINTDPLFVQPVQQAYEQGTYKMGTYYLMPGSPCIDQGTVTDAPSQDQEGIARPQGAGIDIGAYECSDLTSCVPRAIFTTDQTAGFFPLTIAFDASPSGGSRFRGAGFLWDFGDGTTGSGVTVFHTYSHCGIYDVSLTITTECGTSRLSLHNVIRVKSPQVTREVGKSGYTHTSIQEAIDQAHYGEIILVHDGIYTENIYLTDKAITLCSENGADAAIIDGNALGIVVKFDHSEGRDSVLDGFTIRNGSADDGAGIFCNQSSPTITHCIISGNKAACCCGGIGCFNASSPSFVHCIISNNTSGENGGGIGCFNASSPTLDYCTISNNTSGECGGGMYADFSPAKITHCLISGNQAEDDGGGVYAGYNSPLAITSCTISSNRAAWAGGGVYCFFSSPVMTCCIVSNNIAFGSDGGGVYTEKSSPLMIACTISGNRAAWCGGGMYCFSSQPRILYGAICQNAAAEGGGGIYGHASSPGISYCLISSNSAPWGDGGGVYGDEESWPKVINSTLSDNTSEGGQIDLKNKTAISALRQLIWPEDNGLSIQKYDQIAGRWEASYQLFGQPCSQSGSNLTIPDGGEILLVFLLPLLD